MRQIISFLIILFFINPAFSQSISIKEIESFIKQPLYKSEQYLLDKSFTLVQTKFNGNDEIKTYSKAFESINLGRTWTTKDGRKLKDVTYHTTDKVAMLYLLSELKETGFKYKSDEYNTEENGRFIFLESDEYLAQVFISATEETNLVKLVEK